MSSRSLSAIVSVGVLSSRAHATLVRALELYNASGLPGIAGEFFVHFNGITAGDEVLARKAGVAYSGSYENMGLYGGFRAIAERCRQPYLLLLENDVIPVEGCELEQCLSSCVADMLKHDILVFSLRSRSAPGQGEPWRDYISCFPVRDPVGSHVRRQSAPLLKRARMRLNHGYLGKFRGGALFAEKSPDLAQPEAIRKLPGGNYLTDSRFQNWSSHSLLVERKFFLEIICKHIDENFEAGFADEGQSIIDGALNSWWWRRRREPMGHASLGAFTLSRLDW
jgi:hypothetical protein